MDDRAALRETGDAESDPTPHQDAAVPDFEAARNVEAAQDTPRLDNDVNTPNAGTDSTPSTIKDSVKIGPNTNNEQEIAPAQSQDGAPMSKDQEGNEPAGFKQDEGEETDQADEANKGGAPQPATHDPGAKAPLAKSQNLLQDTIRENELVKKEKKEKEEEDAKFKERLKIQFMQRGYTEAQAQARAIDLSRPTWIRVNGKWLLPETLDHYDLPWEWHTDLEYIVIKQYVDQDLQDKLFEHTRMLKERTMMKERRMKDVTEELLASDSETKPPCEDHSGNEVSDGDVPRQSDWQTYNHGVYESSSDMELGLNSNGSISQDEQSIEREMAHEAERIYGEGPFKYLQDLHRTNILLARAKLYHYRDKSKIDYHSPDLHRDIKIYMEAVEMYRSFLSKDQIPPKDQAVRI